MSEVIKSYKGFNKDMTCTPKEGVRFQYEEGKEYETDVADVCKCGFHACEYPLDVFRYYEPAKAVFHEVEQSGEISKNGGDSKVSSTKIKIGASINIAGLVKAAIEYTTKRIVKKEDSDGYRGASSNTGDYGASSNTGNMGASSNTGYRGASEAGHPNSVAVAWGAQSKAKGVKGSYLVLAEWIEKSDKHWLEEAWDFKGAKMVRVDGETVKEDTFYTIKNGEIVEA